MAVTTIGRVEVVCGPMFAGKTEELMRRVRRALIGARHIFQPLQLKRLYLSLSHDESVLNDTLELIDTTMADLARSAAA